MKPTAKIFILSFFLALNLPLKGAVTPDSYVVIFEKDTAFTVTDSLFYAISQKIVFPSIPILSPDRMHFGQN